MSRQSSPRSTIANLILSAILMLAVGAEARHHEPPHGIVHESEFQRLWAQKGEEWTAEDKDVARGEPYTGIERMKR